MIRKNNLTWSQKLSDHLNQHIARKKWKEETKNKQTPVASAHLIQYRFKIQEGSLEGISVTMEEKICERDEF